MTTEEAMTAFQKVVMDYADELAAAQAALARVTAERDRLIEAWPEYRGEYTPRGLVRHQIDGVMPRDWANADENFWLWHHDTKAAAVRAAAGLDAGEGVR